MRDQRHWLVRWIAEIVVLSLLVLAGLTYRFDLGDRFLGPGADPRTEPAAVAAPDGLVLPPVPEVAAVASASPAATIDRAAVAARLRPLLRRGILGRHFAVLVTDQNTGEQVFRVGVPQVTPASTAKILTGAAVLEALGPMARFRTSVGYDPRTRQVVLVGGGDPLLAGTAEAADDGYPRRADLDTLARAAVRQLRSQGVRRARLAYDDSYFTGPSFNPRWRAGYFPSEVPPIGALWVEEGRSATGYGFIGDPAAVAGKAFRDALVRAGLKVRGTVGRAVATPRTTEIAQVSSPPLGEIVERTLALSDNAAAEVLARHVGLAERQDGSFAAGAAAVLDVVTRLGVPTTGARLYDGSGLSRDDLLAPETLVGVLQVASSPEHPDLRHVVTGLPVAGFTGSLRARFDRGPAAARGRVRAKTGTLTGVHGLAGVVRDVSGAEMAFAVVADRVAVPKTLDARLLIDRIAAALGACTCGVGSSP